MSSIFPPPPRREADVELGPNFGSYCRVCIDFEHNGLACFDEDGTYGGHNGEMIIEQILIRFEQVELYKDCTFLRDFLVAYRSKFRPTNQPAYSQEYSNGLVGVPVIP